MYNVNTVYKEEFTFEKLQKITALDDGILYAQHLLYSQPTSTSQEPDFWRNSPTLVRKVLLLSDKFSLIIKIFRHSVLSRYKEQNPSTILQ